MQTIVQRTATFGAARAVIVTAALKPAAKSSAIALPPVDVTFSDFTTVVLASYGNGRFEFSVDARTL